MNNPGKNPYVGTRTFSESEKDLFFGREREARDLVSLVALERLMLFYAQSGTGKSSLINTRLIPGLEAKGFEVLPKGRVTSDLPDVDIDNVYIYSLMRSLVVSDVDARVLGKMALTDFLANLARDEDTTTRRYFHLARSSSDSLQEESQKRKRRVLIIDQFEEIFSAYPEEWKSRPDFFVQLAEAMEADPYLWVVLAMREDYIAYLDPYAHLMPGGLGVRYYMQRMEYDDALKAVTMPVREIRPYADQVAEKLVEDLCGKQIKSRGGKSEIVRGQFVEPIVLQAVCYRLWEKLPPEGSQITEADLSEYVGNVNQALGDYYAERVKDVAGGDAALKKGINERRIREWFEKALITSDNTRNKVVQAIGRKSGGIDDAIVQEFVRHGDLVRAERSGGGAVFYELTHDRLVEPVIANNKKWNSEHSSPFRSQAEAWEESGRKKTHLLSDQALITAEQWSNENPGFLSPIETNFIEAGRTEQDLKEREEKRLRDEQQQKLQQARRSAVIGFSLLALAVIAIIFAFLKWNEANESAAEAIKSKNTAVAAQTNAFAAQATAQFSADYSRANELGEMALGSSVSIDQSILLSVAAYNKSPNNPQAQRALAQNYQQNLQRLQRYIGKIANPENPAKDFELSPNGQILAVRGERGITIWTNLSDPAKAESTQYPITDMGLKMYFSPDNKILAAVGRTGIHWWSLDENAIRLSPGEPINAHLGEIEKLIVAQDEKTFVSIGEDKSVFRWDLARHEKNLIPVESENIMISPSGETLAAVDQNNNISLWSVKDSASFLETSGEGIPTFSPDGNLFATVNFNQTVIVRTIGNDALAQIITPELKGNISKMVFSNINEDKEGYLAVSDGNQTIVWDIKNDEQVGATMTGVPERFSSDARILVIVTKERSIQPYCLTLKLLGDPLTYNSFAGFAPDARVFAVQSWYSRKFSLWEVSEKCELISKGAPFPAVSVLFNPKGKMLASLESNGDILLRDTGTGARIGAPLHGPAKSETNGSLYFHPAGNLLAFTSENNLLLWDLDKNPVQIPVPGSIAPNSISVLSFAADDLLLIGYESGRITMWNARTGEVTELESETKGRITNLIFDPVSKKEALSISRNSVFLVNATTGEIISRPMAGTFLDVQWEKNLLTTLQKDKIILWNLRTGERIGVPLEGRTAHFSSDGTYLLIGSEAGFTLYSYDAAGLTPVGKSFTNVSISPLSFYDVSFSPDHTQFIISTIGSRVYLYKIDIDPGNRNVRKIIYRGRSSYSYSGTLGFSPDSSKYLYFYQSPDGFYINLFDLALMTSYRQSLGSSSSLIRRDGSNLLLGNLISKDITSRSLTSIALWDIDNFPVSHTAKIIETVNLDLDQDLKVRDFRPDREGKTLATLGEDGSISFWNVEPDVKSLDVGVIIGDIENPVYAATISSDGRKRAIDTKAGIVVAETGITSNTSQPFNEHILQLNDVLFNLDATVLVVEGDSNQTVFYGRDDQAGFRRLGVQIDAAFDPKYIDKGIWVTLSDDDSRTIWDSATGNKIRDISSKDSLVGNSADGRYFAIRDSEGATTLWNKTGNQIGAGASISGDFKAFNPGDTSDTYFATQDSEGNTTLWKINPTDEVIRVDEVTGVFDVFSPNGKYMVIHDLESNLILWDIAADKQILKRKGAYVAFSSSSELMAYVYENQISLLNVVAGKTIGQPIKGTTAKFSLDDHFLISKTSPFLNRTTTFLLDTKTGRQIGKSFDGEFQFPSPDGRMFATTDYSQSRITSKLWDAVNGKPLWSEIDFSELVGFSPDGKVLISRRPGSITLLDAANPHVSLAIINAKVFFSTDNRFAVAINHADKEISLWNIGGDQPGRRNDDFSKIGANLILSAAFSRDGKILALFGRDGLVLWNVEKGEQIGLFQEKSGIVTKMLFSPSNLYLASLGNDGIIVWSLYPSPVIKTKIILDTKIINMSFGEDDSITYLSDKFDVFNFNLNTLTRKPWAKFSIGNPTRVCDYSLSSDGTKLAFRTDKLFIWDNNIETLMTIAKSLTSPCNDQPGALAFSPDSKILAVGDGDRIDIFKEWGDKEPVKKFLGERGSFTKVASMVFVDDQTLAVQSAPAAQNEQHARISLWSLKSFSKTDEITAGDLEGLTSNASKLLYRDDKERVALRDFSPTGLSDFNEIRDLLCTSVRRNFTRAEWEQFLPSEPYPKEPKDATCPQWPIESETQPTPIPTP